jgi:hypothetical protein
MRALAAYRDGIRRVNGALALVAGVSLVTLLTALPLSFVVRGAIETHLGASLAADAAADGASYEWLQEFAAQATGVAATLGPSVAGIGAVLDNVDGVLDNLPLTQGIAGVTAAWLLVWSFLSGGILDRLARQRPVRAPGFFAACGVHFWRFLRLGVVALPVYAFLFAYVHGWLLDDAYEALTRDLSVERTAFAVRLGLYAVFAGLLVLWTTILDFTRVRIVVEDRRSALAGLAAGSRFVRRHLGAVAALYLVNTVALAVAVVLYGLLSPGAPPAGLGGWAALLLGQLYIVARHYLKLVFYGAQLSLFQSALAHAAYTAAPVVVWPDSPAAESIINAEAGSIF